MHSRRHKSINFLELFAVNRIEIQSDSTLLLGFPFIGHGNPDSNLESSRIFPQKRNR
jgi:hypothetical protein